ncbi:hypothetical protein D3C78_1054150 [compost metagenome]
MLIQRLQLFQRRRFLPGQPSHQPPVFHRQLKRRRIPMEQSVILRLGLRQTTGGRHQPRLLQLLAGFRLGQQHIHFRLAIGAGLRRNLFQLIQLLLRQRLIPLA